MFFLRNTLSVCRLPQVPKAVWNDKDEEHLWRQVPGFQRQDSVSRLCHKTKSSWLVQREGPYPIFARAGSE